MRPEVRLRLMRAAVAFYKSLNMKDLVIEDIVMTGSNAAYNYTKFSDLDVHLIVDFAKTKYPSVADEFFRTKKAAWSELHDVSIKGHDVELYVENDAQPATSNGLFSILHNEWIDIPSPTNPKINDKALVWKVRRYAAIIDRIIADKDNWNDIDAMLARLKKLRQNGLADGGEFSTENLTFKTLRSLGYLKRLWDKRTSELDASLSLK